MKRRLWGEKPYYSFDYYLKTTYGQKLYKVALNAGMTCPNRDGTLGERGCIFCSAKGSGDFSESAKLSVSLQIDSGWKTVAEKFKASSCIAYFQAFTNTYAPVSYLRKIFWDAASHPRVKILSIATRPDCLEEEVLDLLEEINRVKPVWIELGLQTIHEDTAKLIRRMYPLSTFEDCVTRLKRRGIPIIVHTITGLPGESLSRMLETIHYLNSAGIQGIKLQLLHVLEGTDLAELYRRSFFPVLSLEEYVSTTGSLIAHLDPSIVIHRLTGDGPSDSLLAPRWSTKKRHVLNQIHSYLKQQDIWQGKEVDHG
ncbi:TIGR01212 family radical SAM protein [Suipraeoptans intestinalis]|uniref:TIGR01212 family radical SAM protein n=1 Tax=Suipraeoptans intestinalis TaxID=2606628 RepID=UPI0023F467E5|nr:TIGR01212 family radical SAM protein [Suipraeoptans intestinalis]MDD7770926.1 TIGR01212 family radical SAM protein [Suipraeoptans intestinalis]MDY3122417.1 TIGR01212 family radical SAM protein [Suipraeoptans intestinalis]